MFFLSPTEQGSVYGFQTVVNKYPIQALITAILPHPLNPDIPISQHITPHPIFILIIPESDLRDTTCRCDVSWDMWEVSDRRLYCIHNGFTKVNHFRIHLTSSNHS